MILSLGRPTPTDDPERHGVLINDLPYLLVPGCDIKVEWSGYMCVPCVLISFISSS